MKKILAVLLCVFMMLAVIPVSMAETYFYEYGPFDVSSEYDLYKDEITQSGNTITIKTGKKIRLILPKGECHIEIKANADIRISPNGDVTVGTKAFLENSGNAVITFDEPFHAFAESTPLIKNSGTLTIYDSTLDLNGGNYEAFSGSGSLTLKNTTVNAISAISGISQKNLTLDHASVTSYGMTSGISVTGNLTVNNSFLEADNVFLGGAVIAGGNVKIEKSVVTTFTDPEFTGSDITAASIVIDRESSVKSNITGITPVNENGEAVHPMPIENTPMTTVNIGGMDFPFNTHNGETTICPYVTEDVKAYQTKEYLTSCDFTIEGEGSSFPYDKIVYDFANNRTVINTDRFFKISSNNIATNQTIFVPSDISAHIGLCGVAIESTADKTGAITIENGRSSDVYITLCDGSINYLKGGPTAAGVSYYSKYDKDVKIIIDGNGALTAEANGYVSALGSTPSQHTAEFEVRSGIISLIGNSGLCAIGFGTSAKIMPTASVKLISGSGLSDGAADSDGAKLHLLKIENPDQKDLTIDGLKTANPTHGSEIFYYAYLGEGEHCIEIGDTAAFYRWNGSAFEQFTPGEYDTGDFTVSGTPIRDYLFANGVLTVRGDVTVKNTNPDKATDDTIKFAADRATTLTLDGININTDARDKSAIVITENERSDIKIVLADGSENSITSDYRFACISKNGGKKTGTLTVTGGGKLKLVNGGAAGIGGDYRKPTANIVIENGIFDINSTYAACIGCSDEARADNITISGGELKLNAIQAACIGSGSRATVDRIFIEGGKFSATSTFGATIGSGISSICGKIAVSGGSGTLTSDGGAAIGATGSEAQNDGLVNISGGEYTLKTKNYPSVGGLDFDTIALFDGVITANNAPRSEYCSASIPISFNSPYSSALGKISFRIPNPDGEKITVDGYDFPHTEHLSEKAVYPLLTPTQHLITVGEKSYDCIYISSTNTFSLRLIHDHEFTGEYDCTETHHWRTCKEAECYFTEEDYKNAEGSGYAEHSFTDFICFCGFENITGARLDACGKIDKALENAQAAASFIIADDAKTAIGEAETVAGIGKLLADALTKIGQIENELSDAKTAAVAELYKAADEYNYDTCDELARQYETAVNKAKSTEEVAGILKEGLSALFSDAMANAKAEACTAIDNAADGAIAKVLTTAEVFKAAVNSATSLGQIANLKETALSVIADIIAYNTEAPDEPTQPDEPTEPDEPDEPTKPSVPACSKCGKNHAQDFFGKIACFFYRISNFFKNLFN